MACGMSEENERRASPLAACGAILAVLAIVGLARGWDATQEAARAQEGVAHDAGIAPPPAPPDAGLGSEQIRRLLAEQPLDVNRATAEELELLPRIGPTLARRVIAEREANGPFESVEAMTRVRGIGPRTVAQLAPLAAVYPGDADLRPVTDSSRRIENE